MTFTSDHLQQTTAATDALLAFFCLGCGSYLGRLRPSNPWKVGVWMCVFGLVGLAALLGTVAHGLVLSERTARMLWMPINLSLGLAVALFVVGAIIDLWGQPSAVRALPGLVAVGLGFFAFTILVPGTFLVFIIYEAIGLLLALYVYVRLAAAGRPGAWWMTLGVLLTAVAAGVQQSRLTLTFVWTFDRNGLFHLVQAMALLVLVVGLRISLRSGESAIIRPARSPDRTSPAISPPA